MLLLFFKPWHYIVLFVIAIACVWTIAMTTIVKDDAEAHTMKRQQQRRKLLMNSFANNDEKIEYLSNHWLTTSISNTDNNDNNKFFQNQVHVLQMADEKYQEMYKERSMLNKRWSTCAGYQYHMLSMEDDDDDETDQIMTDVRHRSMTEEHQDNDDCVYTKKVKRISTFFDTLNDGEWMIFVDMDAYYQSPSCTELDSVIFKQMTYFNDNNQRRPKCEVMFHICTAGINSGILIVQKTPQTTNLIQGWYDLQLKHGFCIGPADQWAFQEVLLDYYNLDDSVNDCIAMDQGPTTFSGRGNCSIDKLQHIKRESEKYYYHNTVPVPGAARNGSRGRKTFLYNQYQEKHNDYSIIPLVGSVSSDRTTNNYPNSDGSICVFDCVSSTPLQCKDCHLDTITNHVDPDGNGKYTCNKRNGVPLFHHKKHFL